MYFTPDDTIAALSSPPGPGGRAVVRLSGPRAVEIVNRVFSPAIPAQRGTTAGWLRLTGVAGEMPATVLHFPAPRSFTGQTVVELHTLGSPPLVDRLLADLLTGGARAAQGGEFALRAFLAGKIDLPKAEALLGTIEAGDRDELRRSLRQLSGGVSRPLEGLRGDLLNLLADLEAGLDFADEDISFVQRPDMLARLAQALAQVSLTQRQVEDRGLSDRPFRVALSGPPNAGKTSLFNALTGGGGIVSDVPGTTRDYLVARLPQADVPIELIDTAGLRAVAEGIESQAQHLGREAAENAELVLWCEPGGASHGGYLVVATQADRVPPAAGVLATSAKTGAGLDDLRGLLLERARRRGDRGLAPSLSRCRHHVAACLTHLRSAHQAVLFDDPPEVVALELRSALEHLGAMTGAVYTDDLLDRVFSRFCIGK